MITLCLSNFILQKNFSTPFLFCSFFPVNIAKHIKIDVSASILELDRSVYFCNIACFLG